ncbi:hypothetical protein TIFTF001_002812 [Ficus carica]|uniref:RNase H type-1 domain-containing protein n=1 Tax=Ficus carica TaxID=3494 RepID=A0AA87Z6J3_FICCA|nr:hypothetical protein TIFTF001_002812 [Ficus carica]
MHPRKDKPKQMNHAFFFLDLSITSPTNMIPKRFPGLQWLDNPLEKKTLAPKVLWHVPSHDQIKINVDATVDSYLEYIGECLAVREGVCLANFLRLDNWVVESDALNTVSAIQNPVAEAPESNIIEDIRDSLSVTRSGMVCYISRDGNRVAHFWAKYAISKSVYCFGVDYVPRWLGPFVKADLAI